jgi:hypothetical protein
LGSVAFLRFVLKNRYSQGPLRRDDPVTVAMGDVTTTDR